MAAVLGVSARTSEAMVIAPVPLRPFHWPASQVKSWPYRCASTLEWSLIRTEIGSEAHSDVNGSRLRFLFLIFELLRRAF